MNAIFLLVVLVISSGISPKTQAQTDSDVAKETKTGEIIFLEHADSCLVLMEQAAQKSSIRGVAIIAFIPGENTESWISRMKVVGTLTDRKTANFLAIAISKAAEMTDTHKDSGSGIRAPMKGEFGYKGGIIKNVKSGYILAVFSGGSSEQDYEAAKTGLYWLAKYY
jgi:hypothetical protein